MSSQNSPSLPAPGLEEMSGSVSPEIKEPKQYFVNFNQDNTSLSVASKSGYKLYSLNNADILEEIYSNGNEDCWIVERLFSSSLVTIVSNACKRKLKVCHFKRGTEICHYSYTHNICGLKLNRIRLVVCLEESLYIHNIRDMKVLHTIRDTPRNPNGLLALSIDVDNCFLAYPGSSTSGEIQIFDCVNLQAQTMIQAHQGPLATFAFSPCGTRIATASEKGTVIRIFSTFDATKLYEFRRGVKRCVTMSCLSFSLCGEYLCCSSNTETVHIFKMEDVGSKKKSTQETGWAGYFSLYLPGTVTKVFNQGRSFAAAHLPTFGCKNVLAISMVHKELRLFVATEEGALFVYTINKNGGDLPLFKTHQISSNDSEHHEMVPHASDPNPSTPHVDEGGILGSYAGIVKGNPMGQMSESEKFREMQAATESPPKSLFHFTDEHEYPPLTQNSE
ncbi:autophagy-related 18a isoform X2 [Leptinotarsa decemlineata]|uniref:autophagy-related 18a isoform X2 n=1 Tax=Leptinotarsa decemlineata TaxID=7539 RepID=UPI000C25509A|nr:WD repeat domain phosphoinositide-interacting protein 2-like isoform X2 [Leptinotarsa decemlineata]